MAGLSRESLRAGLGAGISAAAALGFANQAAHPGAVDVRLLGAALGGLGFLAAVRLAGGGLAGAAWRPYGRGVAGLLTALLPLAARMEGRELWAGGAWLGLAGTVGALACLLTASSPSTPAKRAGWIAARGAVVAGLGLACFEPWTAAWAVLVLGATGALALADRGRSELPRGTVVV